MSAASLVKGARRRSTVVGRPIQFYELDGTARQSQATSRDFAMHARIGALNRNEASRRTEAVIGSPWGMRKLICILNTMIARRQKWDVTRYKGSDHARPLPSACPA